MWFADHGFAFDYVLYSNYERMVEDLLDGRLDVAWNSPLAWVRARRLGAARGVDVRALVMRDTDCDLTSIVVVPIDSLVAAVADLGRLHRRRRRAGLTAGHPAAVARAAPGRPRSRS